MLSSRHATDLSPTLIGATPGELRSAGYQVRRVPSIDGDYERCATKAGVAASICWARLDQFIVGHLVAVIPLSTSSVIRLEGPDVVGFSVDQAFGEPSLDRIVVHR
jgi:hypothetical protein